MAIAPIAFPTSQAFSDLGLMPSLGNLGKALATPPTLASLGQRYAPNTPDTTASSAMPSVPSATPSSGGTAFAAPPTSGDVDAAIRATAAAAGMDVPTWKAIASIESSLNPSSNSDRPTQYKGLFQIGSRGEGSEWSRHGRGNIYDAMDNASAAASLAQENNSWFKNNYGRDPTAVETYMMHQQGRGFYANGTMTNVAGNRYPGMSGAQTPQSFEQGWGREIERRAKSFNKPDEASDNGD
jgi:hypothetical protein